MGTWRSIALIGVCLGIHLGWAEESLQPLEQDLAQGDYLRIEDGSPLPTHIRQRSARAFTRQTYSSLFEGVGVHVAGGHLYRFAGLLEAVDDDACSVLGVHGPHTVLEFSGRWQSDGIYNFPHLILRQGGHIRFSQAATVDLVMERDYFTRQLWVWGDGTGIIELEKGFRADHSQSTAVPTALGTIRLGGATLITHHTRNLPANTRPDGRGGHYQNGHVVFERVPGNRWVVHSTNQVYRAQIDFDQDGVIETQADLSHAGQRVQALPLPAGVHFTSSGAFRTTATGVTIRKTGPAMLALKGEQSYRPDSHLIVDQGLVRMATNPGLGRAANDAGPFLHVRIEETGRLHLTAAQVDVTALELHDQAQAWLDRHSRLSLKQPLIIGKEAHMHAAGVIDASLQVYGRLHVDGRNGPLILGQEVMLRGSIHLTPSRQGSALLTLGGKLELEQGAGLTLSIPQQPRQRPQSGSILIDCTDAQADLSIWAGTITCDDQQWILTLEWNGEQLILADLQPVEDRQD